MRNLILIGFVIFSCAAYSVAQTAATSQPSGFDTKWGSVKDGKFVSVPLKLSLPVPSDVHVISTAESEVLSSAGKDMLKQGAGSDKRIDEAAVRTIKLIALSAKPPGSPENSALELVAAKQAKGVTASMNLAANLMVLRGSPITLKRSLGSVKLGSNVFAAAELEGVVSEIRFKQRMYVVMHRGYAIVCAVTYSTDEQLTILEGILADLSLTK